MVKSSLCDYNDASILVKGTVIITKAGVDETARNAEVRNKKVNIQKIVHHFVIASMK